MTPRVLALVGLPGTGKTALAQAIAASRMAAGRPTVVLHTELLRFTLQLAGFRALEEEYWQGDPTEHFRIIHPYVHQHADKARREGYDLIVEGGLCTGFAAADRYIQLQAPPEVCAQRLRRQNPARLQVLQSVDPRRLDDLLEDHATEYREVLTTEAALSDLVLGVESTWNPPLVLAP